MSNEQILIFGVTCMVEVVNQLYQINHVKCVRKFKEIR
jgi:hypothetical protein